MIIIKFEAFISNKRKNEENEDYFRHLSGKFYIVCDCEEGKTYDIQIDN